MWQSRSLKFFKIWQDLSLSKSRLWFNWEILMMELCGRLYAKQLHCYFWSHIFFVTALSRGRVFSCFLELSWACVTTMMNRMKRKWSYMLSKVSSSKWYSFLPMSLPFGTHTFSVWLLWSHRAGKTLRRRFLEVEKGLRGPAVLAPNVWVLPEGKHFDDHNCLPPRGVCWCWVE